MDPRAAQEQAMAEYAMATFGLFGGFCSLIPELILTICGDGRRDLDHHLAMLELIMCSLNSPPPLPRLHTCIFDVGGRVRQGVDLVARLIQNERNFWLITGETVQSFQNMVRDLTPFLLNRQNIGDVPFGREFILTPANRILMFLVWLRQFPTLELLSVIFDISVTTAHRDLSFILPIVHRYLRQTIVWPDLPTWEEQLGQWEYIPYAVGAIDGTVVEILRPEENQGDFYSGHHHYHAINTIVICDARGQIRYLKSGFFGRRHDSAAYREIPPVGPGQELNLPESCVLLADKGFPCEYPLVTSYREGQIRNGK